MENRVFKTIFKQLEETAERMGGKETVIFPAEAIRETYADLVTRSNQVAKALLGLGLKRGEHIGIWSINTSKWLDLLFAAAKIGVVIVPLNPSFTYNELKYIINQAEIKVLFSMKTYRGQEVEGITSKLVEDNGMIRTSAFPSLKDVYYMDEAESTLYEGWSQFLDQGIDITDNELELNASVVTVHDIYSIQYTSGTTAQPKGAMLDQFGSLNTGKTYGELLHLDEESCSCIMLPLFHCFGNILSVLAGIVTGSKMVIIDQFAPQKVLEAVDRERCDMICGVPTMFSAILHEPSFKEYDITSLEKAAIGGSVCSPFVMEQIAEQFNMNCLSVGYGLSEAASLCTFSEITESHYRRLFTVGNAIPDVEIKIVNPQTQEEVECGVEGELCIRGYNIMKGYYNKPEETAKAIDAEGWLHTGDIATVDEDGFYKIVGRYKDIIIRGGENISPSEVEEVIRTLDNIKDVQIVGVPDPIYVENIAAFVITKDGNEIPEESIRNVVKKNLAFYKIPNYILFTSTFPMTASGKIQKFKLRQIAIEKLGLIEDRDLICI